MVEAGRGHLAFVGSISGKAATKSSPPYNATKFGLRGFALGLKAGRIGGPTSESRPFRPI
jgi:NADP-dependent 3-hydroxy acid dehydrogenase YdfG